MSLSRVASFLYYRERLPSSRLHYADSFMVPYRPLSLTCVLVAATAIEPTPMSKVRDATAIWSR